VRLVAVVCSYWPDRRTNTINIVNDLRRSTRPPDTIIVLDNGDSFRPEQVPEGIAWVRGHNWECRGKFVAGLLDPANYYLFCDDDTTVGPTTCAELLAAADGKRGFVTGYWGVRLAGRSFMGGQVIGNQPEGVTTQVDAFHGRVMFMAYDALVRTLQLEEWVRVRTSGRKRWPTEGDDLICGLANPGSVMVHLSPSGEYRDLDQGSQAMQTTVPNYFAMRDAFCGDVLDAIAEHGLPA
jgi:hypothetical protein